MKHYQKIPCGMQNTTQNPFAQGFWMPKTWHWHVWKKSSIPFKGQEDIFNCSLCSLTNSEEYLVKIGQERKDLEGVCLEFYLPRFRLQFKSSTFFVQKVWWSDCLKTGWWKPRFHNHVANPVSKQSYRGYCNNVNKKASTNEKLMWVV